MLVRFPTLSYSHCAEHPAGRSGHFYGMVRVYMRVWDIDTVIRSKFVKD